MSTRILILLCVLSLNCLAQFSPFSPFSPPKITASSWTPLTEGGVVIWHAARLLSGTNDGDLCTQFVDFSGANRHGYAPATNAPYFTNNVINGLPAFRFGGTNGDHTTYVALSNVFGSLTAAEVFLIVKIDADPPANTDLSGLWYLGFDTSFTHFPYDGDGIIYDTFGTTSRQTTANPTPTLTSWRLYNVTSAASAWTNRLDGTVLFGTAANTVGFPSLQPLLGMSGPAGPVAMKGFVAEIVVFDHNLGAARTSANAYFSNIYGVP